MIPQHEKKSTQTHVGLEESFALNEVYKELTITKKDKSLIENYWAFISRGQHCETRLNESTKLTNNIAQFTCTNPSAIIWINYYRTVQCLM